MLPPRGYLTVDAAAVRAGVSRNTISRLARAGKLPATVQAGRIFVEEAGLVAYFAPKPVMP